MNHYGEEEIAVDNVHHHIDYEKDDAPYFVKPRLVRTTDSEDRVLRERSATHWPGIGALETLTNVISGGKRPDGSPYAGDEATWRFEAGMTVSGAVAFDALGRVVEQGQPAFSAEPDTTFTAVEMLRATRFQHDVLSRTRLVEVPDPKATRTGGVAQTWVERDLVQFEGQLRFQETVIAANGKSRNTYRDVGGRIAAVEEWNTIAGVEQQIVTRYEHNPLGELVRVTDARNNATTATYDTVGRMVELVSPDAGRTEWRYDLVGNLRAKQTAELGLGGQLIRYEYDYSRLKKIDYPVTQDVVYTYGAAAEAGDAQGNLAGRLSQETSAAGMRSYRYDRFGNVVELAAEFPRLREPHRGPYQATLKYLFDSLGRMQEIHFPGSGEEIVRYGYDRGGSVVSVVGENQRVNPQHPDEPMTTEYLRHIGYDEFGQRVRVVAGNGVETKYRYDESTRRLSDVDADHQTPQMRSMGRAPRAFQRLHYEYDLVGNVLGLDNAAPFDESLGGAVMVGTTRQRFAYDDLNQLTEASGIYQERGNEQQRYALAIEYDVLGNLKKKGQEVARYVPKWGAPGEWQKQDVIRERTYRNEYRYTGPRPHAANEVDEFVPSETDRRLRELSYDANGNHKQWRYRNSPQRTLRWDEDNRLVSVSENGQELSRALYDGAGERRVHLHRVAGEEETAYVDQHLVVRNGVVATKHLFAGETRIASKIDADFFQEPPVLYYHPDQLGSTQYVTDQDQQLSQHVEYLPSGELWADQTDSRFQNRQPYLFTGKELDLSTGLYYHGARSYEPRLGVWLSPDPILDQYTRGAPNGGVYDPIHLGLYTYTRNNPLRFVDPTGLAEECVDGGCLSFVGPLDSSEQSIDPEDTMCGSGVCVDGGPVERDALRHVTNDPPLEESVVDPIDLVGIGGTAFTLVKAGGKALVKLVARKSTTKAEALVARGGGKTVQDFLPESAKRLEAAKLKYGGDGVVNMAKKADIKQIDRIVREVGLSPGQREIFHEEMRALKGSDGLGSIDDLLDLAREIKASFPKKWRNPMTVIANSIPGAISERLNAVVGQRCWHVGAGGLVGSSFSLALGARVPRERPLRNAAECEDIRLFQGEFRFLVWCSWRLDGDVSPVSSSDREAEDIARSLEALRSQTLVGATCHAPAWDLCLVFSAGLRLSVFCDHLPGDASIEQNWELWCGNEALLIGPGYSWRIHMET
ncbi:RHS repeat-associated core domain-containing protein [Sorangium sp. So ce321]|uniref:RHS repeat domain-containing protein n=1 Tax=Sorangium sp. So ce321 TaxID=3133300 RepID=UPI003F5F435E